MTFAIGDILLRITSIISEFDEENVGVIGDFNAPSGSTRFPELLSMCVDHQFTVAIHMLAIVFNHEHG